MSPVIWRARATTSTGATSWYWNRKPTCKKRGQASPDDGDALALTFAQAVAQAEVEDRDEERAFRRRRTAFRREGEQDSGPVPNSSRSVATLAF